MAYSAAELALHRLGTQHFIDADYRMIALTPRTQELVNGTKKFAVQSPRPAQKFKVIFQNTSGVYQNPALYREVGDRGGVQRFDFILVGEYDAVVAVHDFWKDGDQQYEVEYIFPYNGYEVKVGGVSHGPKPIGT